MQEQELTQAQAVSLLVQAADLAQSRGAFKLEEASMVAQAIRLLVPGRGASATTEPVEEESDVNESETGGSGE